MGSTNQKYIIVKDRVELFKDFSLNLLYYINYYYIDYQSLNADKDIRNHFQFCYNKVCDEFLQEGIDFKKNNELKEYFYTYYYHQFYKLFVTPVKQNELFEAHEKFWKSIFEIDKQKNKNTVNLLIEIYNIFDKSINQEKNILEIV